jgi:hypothetical protein
MFDYALIDAQYILTRNYFAIRGSAYNELSESAYLDLCSSFLRSIINLECEVQAKKVILLWDTYPYYKNDILYGEFKSDRQYTTEDDVQEEGIDDEERERRRIDASNLQQRSRAKIILKDLAGIALPSMYKRGFEADDLAYIIAREIKSRGETGVLISRDSDWGFWINDCFSWYNPKTEEYKTHSDIRKENNIPEELSLFDYKKYYDSFYGSHNALQQTCTDEMWYKSFIEFYSLYKKLGASEELFKDPDLFKRQLESFDIEAYPEFYKLKSMMYYIDKSGRYPSLGNFDEFASEIGLQMPSYMYNRLLENLDPTKFYD